MAGTTPILQFGTSRFLQAHADLMISEALARGEALGPITIVQSSGDPYRARRLKALAAPDGFPVRIRGLHNGARVDTETRVNSVHRTLTTEQDWPVLEALFEREVSHVLSNTGDTGFAPQPADSAERFDQTMSYPAKLRLLLRHRFEAGGKPITIMPMELVSRNGEALRERILDLARKDSATFRAWLESQVIWANSLVDRIVAAPLEPAGAVAEPYALWAIEKQPRLVPPCRHPDISLVNDLGPVENRKLFILNLAHTLLADRWLREQRPREECVAEMIADPEIAAWLGDAIDREVLPGFGHDRDIARAYWQTCLERFQNPFLDHRLADIAENHKAKVERRVAGYLHWQQGDAQTYPTLASVAT